MDGDQRKLLRGRKCQIYLNDELLVAKGGLFQKKKSLLPPNFKAVKGELDCDLWLLGLWLYNSAT